MNKKIWLSLVIIGTVMVLIIATNYISRRSLLETSQKFGDVLVQSYADNEITLLRECEVFLELCEKNIDKYDPEKLQFQLDMAENLLGTGGVSIYLVDDEPQRPDGDGTNRMPIITLSKALSVGKTIAIDIDFEKLRDKRILPGLPKPDSYFLVDDSGRLLYYITEKDADYNSYQKFIDGIWPGIIDGSLNGYDEHIQELDNVNRNIYYVRQDNGWTSIITIPHMRITNGIMFSMIISAGFLVIGIIIIFVLLIRDFKNEARQHIYEKAIKSMARSHREIYYLDFKKKTCQQVFPFSKNERNRMDYATAIKQHFMNGTIVDENVAEIKNFLDADNLKKAFKTHNYVEMKYKRRSETGAIEWCLTSITVADKKNDEAVSATLAIKSIQDVVEKEEQQKEALKLAAQNALAANQAKSEFLSKMSHDIRTPMNAIMGMISIAMMESDNAEKVKTALETISESGAHLVHLINEVLDMSKIESGKIALANNPFNLANTFERLENVFMSELQRKNLTYITDIGCVAEDYVVGDEQKLMQIMVNILGNAVKYTEEGGTIKVSARKHQTQANGLTCYEFSIEDNGVGMDVSFIDHIFEPFEREESANNREIEGTGLGMPIAYSLAKIMGGDISVQSVLHEGTTVIVSVYLKTEDKIEIPNENLFGQLMDFKTLNFAGKRAMIVDDNVVNAQVGKEFLAAVGIEVASCEDGAAAVSILRNSQPYEYDIVFMDIHMPKMDGYEACGLIRLSDRVDLQQLPIIAMTADAFSSDVKKALDSGMNGHLAKPIQIAQLKQILLKWL